MSNIPVNIKTGIGGDNNRMDEITKKYIDGAMSFAMVFIHKGMEYADKYAQMANRNSITLQDVKIGLRYAMFENWDEDKPEIVEKMSEYYEKLQNDIRILEKSVSNEDILSFEDNVTIETIEEDNEPFTFADPNKDNFVKIAHCRVIAWDKYEPTDNILQILKAAINNIDKK